MQAFSVWPQGNGGLAAVIFPPPLPSPHPTPAPFKTHPGTEDHTLGVTHHDGAVCIHEGGLTGENSGALEVISGGTHLVHCPRSPRLCWNPDVPSPDAPQHPRVQPPA